MNLKKEQKNNYKKLTFKVGVFQLKNLANNKIFIGSSIDLEASWNRLKMELKFGNYPNAELQNDWAKYGVENFEYEILSEIKQEDDGLIHNYRKEARQLEQLFLDELQTFGDNGYNIKKENN